MSIGEPWIRGLPTSAHKDPLIFSLVSFLITTIMTRTTKLECAKGALTRKIDVIISKNMVICKIGGQLHHIYLAIGKVKAKVSQSESNILKQKIQMQ